MIGNRTTTDAHGTTTDAHGTTTDAHGTTTDNHGSAGHLGSTGRSGPVRVTFPVVPDA
ncbi:hypothetical protein ACIQ9E_08955 [Streptomyces sp. NPDC094448]|uniref:hypothetical protein n=1 Tax=Streptomyces sp. NPDC094448 TaxID=3366063 RepID=UPI0037FA4BCA